MGLSLLTQWLRVEEMSQTRSQLCHLLTKSYSMDIREKKKTKTIFKLHEIIVRIVNVRYFRRCF